MKKILSICFLAVSLVSFAQTKDLKQPIRFIFESIHDHLGNKELNSQKVQLYSYQGDLLYEADLYEGVELDEQFFYYEDDKLVRDRRIFHDTRECGDYRIEYDAKGNNIKESNIDAKGQVLEQKTRTYDEAGNMIKEVVEFYHHEQEKMIIESSFDFTYYKSGKVKSKTGYEGEHVSVTVTYNYEYTEFSKTVKRTSTADNFTETWKTTINEQGWILQEVHSKGNGERTKNQTIDIEYDDYGHILTETISKTGSSVKKIKSFEYKYDDHGNWIERTETITHGAKVTKGNVLKRHIEYYEESEYAHPPMEMDESYNYETRNAKRVKVFQESHVRINNNEGELEWVVRRNGATLFQVDEYDYEEGKLVQVNHLIKGNNTPVKTTAYHNESGFLVGLNTNGANGGILERLVYTYDKNGALEKMEEHQGSKVVLTEVYAYRKDGKLVSTDITEFQDKSQVTYEYNSEGLLVQMTEKGEGTYITKYEYEDGLLKRELDFEGKAKEPTEEVKFTYDKRGELIKSAIYKGKEIHSEVDYTYFE